MRLASRELCFTRDAVEPDYTSVRPNEPHVPPRGTDKNVQLLHALSRHLLNLKSAITDQTISGQRLRRIRTPKASDWLF